MLSVDSLQRGHSPFVSSARLVGSFLAWMFCFSGLSAEKVARRFLKWGEDKGLGCFSASLEALSEAFSGVFSNTEIAESLRGSIVCLSSSTS